MKRLIRIMFSFLVLMISDLSAVKSLDIIHDIKESIIGGWVHFSFYYNFSDSGVMTAIQMQEEPKGFKTFAYEMFRIGRQNFIRFGADLSDSTNIGFIYVDIDTDSTAFFALGTPFIPADSPKGLMGKWKHVRDFKIISLSFGTHTIEYEEKVLEVADSRQKILEKHSGTYLLGKGKDKGRVFVTFEDGAEATLLPVTYKSILYLFDLAPRKSMFRRINITPTYSDYVKAKKKNG